MKKYIIGIILLCFALTACYDLNLSPLDASSDNNFWETESQLRGAKYVCYSIMQKDMLNFGEGCGESAMWGDPKNALNKISSGVYPYTIQFPVSSWWNYFYQNIFYCNKFLENYKKANISESVKEKYAAEIKVIRALDYFYLTSLYGDVPLVTRVLSPEDPEMTAPRTPKQEVIDYILNDLDQAAAKLGEDIPTGENSGRVNKWTALGLKSRIALFNERWEIAYQAAESVMKSGKYELYNEGGHSEAYYNLFTVAANQTKGNINNKETMMAGIYKEDKRMHNLSAEIMSQSDYNRFNPSKSLVDTYLCIDGKPAVRGYEYANNPEVRLSPLYKEEEYADYWKNRDPRMEQTIMKPGSPWWGGNDGINNFDVFEVLRFVNKGRTGSVTLTGFYFKKYSSASTSGVPGKDYNDIIIMRYAEILLNYIEAIYHYQNEQVTQQQIDRSINLLRNRVGMHPMILTELVDWNMDIKKEILRERRIELAFEGLRFLDILRLKEGNRLAQSTLGVKKAIIDKFVPLGLEHNFERVNENGDIIIEGSSLDGTGPRVFDQKKHYLWPIPQMERMKNPNLGQNPNWPV